MSSCCAVFEIVHFRPLPAAEENPAFSSIILAASSNRFAVSSIPSIQLSSVRARCGRAHPAYSIPAFAVERDELVSLAISSPYESVVAAWFLNNQISHEATDTSRVSGTQRQPKGLTTIRPASRFSAHHQELRRKTSTHPLPPNPVSNVR